MRYLVIRLSALGDVAMTLPVLYSVARANPQHRFTLLTQPFLTSLLLQGPPNLEAMAIDIKHEEHSFAGLLRYAKRLSGEGFDMVIDLHNVLRSRILRYALMMHGTPSKHLRKPRKLRALLTARPPLKRCKPIGSVIDRYAAVFRKAGLSIGSYGQTETPPIAEPMGAKPPRAGTKRIGIAPFAGHQGKIYPIERMESLVRALASEPDTELVLFGGTRSEREILDHWASTIPNVRNIAGKLSLPEEIAVMQTLDTMISMDSANMHFASLVGTRVVSIWCATHPFAGFLGFGQRTTDAIELDLDCRPCSIFGNKPCYRKENKYACQQIPIETILDKVLNKEKR